MFRKLAFIATVIFFSAFNANAGSDGELILKCEFSEKLFRHRLHR